MSDEAAEQLQALEIAWLHWRIGHCFAFLLTAPSCFTSFTRVLH